MNEEQTLEHMKNKKFQVEVEVLGKIKYAYCDDLSELDYFVKIMKARIIEVVELNQ